MPKLLFIIFLLNIILSHSFLHAQKYFSRTIHIDFYSHTPLEDIKASTQEANGILKEETGDFAFKVLMTTFHFPKAAMQEHFNDKYVESSKFPKAVFKGKIENFKNLFAKEGQKKKLAVKGEMEIHGVKKIIEIEVELEKQKKAYVISSTFDLAVSDFKISIPSHLVSNIAKTIKVNVKGTLDILEK